MLTAALEEAALAARNATAEEIELADLAQFNFNKFYCLYRHFQSIWPDADEDLVVEGANGSLRYYNGEGPVIATKRWVTDLTPPPVPPPPADKDRFKIEVDANDARITSATIDALNARGCVYQRGGKIVEPQHIPDIGNDEISRPKDNWQIATASTARVRLLAAQTCRYYKSDADGREVDTTIPQQLPGMILAAGTFPFPRLGGIVESPTLRADGTLIDSVGYDEKTGIFLTKNLWLCVPERPTRDDAIRAIQKLLDIITDFPFSKEAGRSVILSAIFSIVARPAVAGPVPMHIFDASMRGSGKSKLADVVSIIGTGRVASRMAYSARDEEMDKRITALAMAGDPFILLDNVKGRLGCPSLDGALTSTSYRGRVLGRSELTPHLPMHAVWCATGNGVIVGADLARRSIFARLEPQCERPEERTDWRYPKLLRHIAEHRAELLGAGLTAVRAYIVADCPSQNLVPMGSYEAWSDLVRSTIVWGGMPDPCTTIADAREADVDEDAFRIVMDNWPVDDDVVVSIQKLIELAEPPAGFPVEAGTERRKLWRGALLGWCPPQRGGTLPDTQALGYALRSMRGNIVGSHRLDRGTHTKTGTPWVKTKIL